MNKQAVQAFLTDCLDRTRRQVALAVSGNAGATGADVRRYFRSEREEDAPELYSLIGTLEVLDAMNCDTKVAALSMEEYLEKKVLPRMTELEQAPGTLIKHPEYLRPAFEILLHAVQTMRRHHEKQQDYQGSPLLSVMAEFPVEVIRMATGRATPSTGRSVDEEYQKSIRFLGDKLVDNPDHPVAVMLHGAMFEISGLEKVRDKGTKADILHHVDEIVDVVREVKKLVDEG